MSRIEGSGDSGKIRGPDGDHSSKDQSSNKLTEMQAKILKHSEELSTHHPHTEDKTGNLETETLGTSDAADSVQARLKSRTATPTVNLETGSRKAIDGIEKGMKALGITKSPPELAEIRARILLFIARAESKEIPRETMPSLSERLTHQLKSEDDETKGV